MELSYDDYAAIGASLIGIIAAQYAMGHVNPQSSCRDYIDPAGLTWQQQFTRDVILTTDIGRNADAERRIAQFVERQGLLDVIADAVAR